MKKIIAICFFSITLLWGINTKVYAVEWTDEMAIAMQNAADSGMSPAEASAAVLGITVNGPIGNGNNSSSYTVPSTPAPVATPAPATAVAAENSTSTANKNTTVETYSHDYDEINDTAKEAFVYFTKDGTPDSVYLNIKANSSQNVITGKELNATTTGKESGRISYVNENNEMIYEWLISNWQSDDSFELDLGVTFNKSENSDFEESYDLAFAGGKELEGNDVIFRVRTNLPDTDLTVYKKTDSGYDGIYTGKTDENGILELHPKELTDYIISSGEPVEAVEKPVKEITEEPDAANPVPVIEPEETTTVPEPKPPEDISETIEEKTAEKKSSPFIPIIIISCVIICGAGIGLILKRKKN